MNVVLDKKINNVSKDECQKTGIMPLIFALGFLVILTVFPSSARTSVENALDICVEKLIPSLFPFMITSELLISFGFGSLTGALLGRPFQKLFGISGNGASAFIAGSLCGLPLGGKYALALYKNGEISLRDCEKLMGISNNAGIGFVVIGIGYSLWGDIRLGWALYIAQILSAMTVGVCVFRSGATQTIAPATRDMPQKSFFTTLSAAVSASAVNMLTVCAYVVFFSTLIGAIGQICEFISLPSVIESYAATCLEISNACVSLYNFSLSNAPVTENIAKILTFFSVGFCGFCAHMQLISFATDSDTDFKKYLLIKLLVGIVCAIFGTFFLFFHII